MLLKNSQEQKIQVLMAESKRLKRPPLNSTTKTFLLEYLKYALPFNVFVFVLLTKYN